MQARDIDALIGLLERHGWRITRGSPKCALQPTLFRHSCFQQFVKTVVQAESRDGKISFLGSDAYCENSGDGWNFIEERLSIPAAEGDDEWTTEVRQFWSDHLPIALSWRGDYAYMALDSRGRIVTGWAPEFEQTTVVAESFKDLIARMKEQANARDGELYLDWLAGA